MSSNCNQNTSQTPKNWDKNAHFWYHFGCILTAFWTHFCSHFEHILCSKPPFYGAALVAQNNPKFIHFSPQNVTFWAHLFRLRTAQNPPNPLYRYSFCPSSCIFGSQNTTKTCSKWYQNATKMHSKCSKMHSKRTRNERLVTVTHNHASSAKDYSEINQI